MKKLNPYLPPWEYIPDAEPRVFNGRVYIYGSHDKYGGKWYCEGDYVSWSAPVCDLSDWKYEGVIYKKDADKRSGNLFAPDCVKGADGKYYLYYSKDDSSVISVAVCDTPCGEFSYLGDVHYKNGEILGDSENEYFMFDPSVLVDNGRVYLYSGSAERGTTTGVKRKMIGCTVTELENDMLTVKTAPIPVLESSGDWESDDYFEAPSARKIGDKYYLVFATMNLSGLYYAVSDSPIGGFVSKGVLLSVSGIGDGVHTLSNPAYPLGNEHGGLCEIAGKWYVFSHRQTGYDGFSRQGVAAPISFREDGTIIPAEITSCGFAESLPENGEYPSYCVCILTGESPRILRFGRNDTEEDFYIGNMCDNAVAGFRYFDFSGGEYAVHLKLCGDGGKITLMLSENGERVVAEKSFNDTDKEITLTGKIPEGRLPIFFRYNGEGKTDIFSFEIKKLTD